MGGQGKEEWMECLLDNLRAFGIKLVDDCSPGRGGMAQDGGTRGGTFHGKMDRCTEKARAGLRYAVVCPNVTGRAKERIAQSKRACAGSLAIVDSSQVARTCILRAFSVCRCHAAFLWRYVCFCV